MDNALFLREKNKSFLFENASNLTHEFLYDNFNKKIQEFFLMQIVITKSPLLSRLNGSFIFSSKLRHPAGKGLIRKS